MEVNGQEIALFHGDRKIHDIWNACVHRGGPLGEGYLEGKIATYPWHGLRFDVSTGASDVNPSVRVPISPVPGGREIHIGLSEFCSVIFPEAIGWLNYRVLH